MNFIKKILIGYSKMNFYIKFKEFKVILLIRIN